MTLLCLLGACKAVCATRWDVTTGVDHTPHYGTGPRAELTVGGELGEACESTHE